ncbi:MAG: FIG00452486: hypothetical protein [Candidatus Burkholderia crenata]|nr:MAG: FIG00452486: hypothetical protein [Candidatus Burkholderia crenata]
MQNSRRESGRLLAGTTGCTHITELCAVLSAAAIQAFAGEVWNTEKGGAPGTSSDSSASAEASNASDKAADSDKPPFQLGRCNALCFDGEAVRQYNIIRAGLATRPAAGQTG